MCIHTKKCWGLTRSRSNLPSGIRRISSGRPVSGPRMATVHRGNAFEERSLKLLEQTMSMSLKRVGGKEDGGIDLLGWWWLPHDTLDASNIQLSTQPRRRVRVIGQCKAEKKKMGPNYVRELEGVLYRFIAMSSSDKPRSASPEDLSPMVALLISESAFTKSTILRAHSSSIPFLLLHLPPIEATSDEAQTKHPSVETKAQDAGFLGSALCNPALTSVQGVLQGHMEVRWERHHLGAGGRPALWWKGERLQSQIPKTPGTSGEQNQTQVLHSSFGATHRILMG